MNALLYTLLALFLFVCLFMTLLILIQKGRGGGLASAFGGAGGNTAFGSKTGDVLTWATSIVFGVFLVLAIVLNLVANRIHAQTAGALAPTPATAAPAAPSDQPDPAAAPGGAMTQPPGVQTPIAGEPPQPQRTAAAIETQVAPPVVVPPATQPTGTPAAPPPG